MSIPRWAESTVSPLNTHSLKHTRKTRCSGHCWSNVVTPAVKRAILSQMPCLDFLLLWTPPWQVACIFLLFYNKATPGRRILYSEFPPKYSSLKQHTFIISMSLWVRNPGMACLGGSTSGSQTRLWSRWPPVLWSQEGWREGEFRMAWAEQVCGTEGREM